MPRKAHKYHYIYKTTCNVTKKYYIGMHSTSILEDGYMGSGKRLRRSLIKHGIENHTKEILEFLPDRKTLGEREKEIVNQEMLDESLCMNIQLGGGGGISSKEHLLRLREGNKKWLREKLKDESYLELIKSTFISNVKNAHKEGKLKYDNFKGKSHTEETIKLMSESSKNKGLSESNSQFGTCWITNGNHNKKIRKGDSIPEGWSLGRKLK